MVSYDNMFPDGRLEEDILYQKSLLDDYKKDWLYADLHSDERYIIEKVRNYTMTCPERMISLIRVVKYLIKYNIEGDFVECGVWKGGSMMIVALVLLQMGVLDRNLYLYDTFDGMTLPTAEDVSFSGDKAIDFFNATYDKEKNKSLWHNCTLEEVKSNIYQVGYPKENILFVKGKVEDTIPGTLPEKVALLRLDTDWYESTYHQMLNLFPVLSKRGILIIDDFGHWKGSKKAVEKYFEENQIEMFLNRVDYTCRLGQKL